MGSGMEIRVRPGESSDEQSQRVHEALGFEVLDRCVHYGKAL
jgi:hypothetical protein